MLEETRLHRIRALLSTFNQISTDKIIQHLGVSRETVRRDVLKLETQGLLRRVHGGIVSTESEPPLAIRNTVREKEKRAIARAAIQQLHAGQMLFIDAGSTTAILAEELLSMPGMTIITNSLSVALTLTSTETSSKLKHDVILLGGKVDGAMQAMFGEQTLQEIRRYRADVALVSPVGVSSGSGVSSFSSQEATVAEAMVRYAKHHMILADHTKIGITSRVVYVEPAEIDTIITDAYEDEDPEVALLRNQCNSLVMAS